MTGVRMELVFERAEGCPVAVASAAVPGPVTDINWAPGDGESVTEQVNVDADGELIPDEVDDLPTFEQVFDYGTQQVYEFDREQSEPCICEDIQETLGPVTDVRARDGNLHVTLHASDVSGLRDLIVEMREKYGDVSVEYLVRSTDTSEESKLVPVDLRKLTARQREVLETAHEMGYFDYPREANAEAVATALDIQSSTFAEHLAAAQGKLLDELVGEGEK